MKKLPLVLILSIFTVKAFSQDTQIDSLVGEIDDTQLGIRMQYVWYPVLKSEAGESLIKLGKASTQKLIEFLDDTTKGIIVQHILVTIWLNELEKAGWDIRSGYIGTIRRGKSQDIGEFLIGGMQFDASENMSEVKVNGLKVYMNKDFRLFPEVEFLKRNKKAWESFIANQKVR